MLSSVAINLCLYGHFIKFRNSMQTRKTQDSRTYFEELICDIDGIDGADRSLRNSGIFGYFCCCKNISDVHRINSVVLKVKLMKMPDARIERTALGIMKMTLYGIDNDNAEQCFCSFYVSLRITSKYKTQ